MKTGRSGAIDPCAATDIDNSIPATVGMTTRNCRSFIAPLLAKYCWLRAHYSDLAEYKHKPVRV